MPEDPPRVLIVTLGCKANQYDSEVMARALRQAGYRLAARGERADLALVNTCTVTQVADAKGRKLIRRIAADNPGVQIVVTGCYAHLAGDEITRLPGVAAVVPNDQKPTIPDLVRRLLPLRAAAAHQAAPPRARALLKIQDGCDHYCTYCAVPFARGPMASRPMADVLDEMRRLAAEGVKEIVLTGIRLGAYGRDLDGDDLASVLRAARDVPVARLRLSSIEPWDVTPDLIAAMAEVPSACPHLHLPLQSGDDGVLSAMGRPHAADDFRRLVGEVRAAIPDVALTTDVMVGFPGEREEAFQRTCALAQEIGLSRLHVFKYSRRPGTRAAGMGAQIAEPVKRARSDHLIAIGERLFRAFAERFRGRDVEVLFESCDKKTGLCDGLTPHYLRVVARGSGVAGRICRVRVESVEADHVTGRLA
jgi:threonylcarbamoyladenosine tRNA methylthiotransferase MtaB